MGRCDFVMSQHRPGLAVQVAVVGLRFGSLVRERGAGRQIARPLAAENLDPATTQWAPP
jgi:hypothetical protein